MIWCHLLVYNSCVLCLKNSSFILYVECIYTAVQCSDHRVKERAPEKKELDGLHRHAVLLLLIYRWAQPRNGGEGLNDFIEGLGPGQIVGRQVLGTSCLGEIQMGLSDKKGRLELEIIRARGLVSKPGAKVLPGELFRCNFSSIVHGILNSQHIFQNTILSSKYLLQVFATHVYVKLLNETKIQLYLIPLIVSCRIDACHYWELSPECQRGDDKKSILCYSTPQDENIHRILFSGLIENGQNHIIKY